MQTPNNMSQSDWISVKDRLPKNGPIYVCYENGTVALWTVYGPFWADITHWMPATLPDPPKSEDQIAFREWMDIQNAMPGFAITLKTAFLAGWQAHEKRGEG